MSATTVDTPTLMVFHRRLDTQTVWRDLAGRLATFCRLVRIELSENTMREDATVAATPPGMITALGGLVAMLATRSDGIHMVSDRYGSNLAEQLAQLHPQALRSISFLDAPQATLYPAPALKAAAPTPSVTIVEAETDGSTATFLAILRRQFVVDHRPAQTDRLPA